MLAVHSPAWTDCCPNIFVRQAKQGLAQLEGQLEGRKQQLQAVLAKARPIAMANQQARICWGVNSNAMLGSAKQLGSFRNGG